MGVTDNYMRKTTKTETATPIEAELVRDNSDVPEFEVVRTVKTGRPLFLTPKRFVRICKLIEQGESASEACRLELVTYQGFRAHVKRNPKYQRRLKSAEETREEFLREFHIENIRKHAPKNLLASLWWLERRYPNQFALRNVIRSDGDPGAKLVGDQITAEKAKEISEQIAEFAIEREKRIRAGQLPSSSGVNDLTPEAG
jgi:hypothetical protein